jgi:hypothetical protein
MAICWPDEFGLMLTQNLPKNHLIGKRSEFWLYDQLDVNLPPVG